MPELRIVRHLIIPVPEWKKCQYRIQPGTRIRKSNLIPECSGTGLSCWMTECRCPAMSASIYNRNSSNRSCKPKHKLWNGWAREILDWEQTSVRILSCGRAVSSVCSNAAAHTAKTKYRNFETYTVFPEKEYGGLSPNFHIHASVSDLYIPMISFPILLEEICRPILGLYKSLTDTWIWKLGLRPRYSQKMNTYVGFSLQCRHWLFAVPVRDCTLLFLYSRQNVLLIEQLQLILNYRVHRWNQAKQHWKLSETSSLLLLSLVGMPCSPLAKGDVRRWPVRKGRPVKKACKKGCLWKNTLTGVSLYVRCEMETLSPLLWSTVSE
jgi:hypothetical protein